ncbi:MAG: outer membrane beta-barrel protein [Saprospiraceae bacterium]|nr:outer membrane beta-barrel protein [Saprospiraceae bacterium]
MSFLLRLLTTALALTVAIQLPGQQFQFGASAGIIASQIDGDNLRGFNKIGYQGGLLGGYALDERNWIAVELRHAAFGSVKKQEQRAHVAVELRSIDVVLGYARRFGDRWDGQQRFRIQGGPRLHRVIKVKSDMIDKEDINTFFLSVQVGVSHLVSPAAQIDLSYTHGLTDILATSIAEIGKLQPYYLSLGASYFFGR